MGFVVGGIAATLLYVLAKCFYRLYLSPLAKFPGPKLAALTPWYNGYYDLIKGGQYIWAIDEMHRKYGPIVRTRPDTLHVNDPAFIDKWYTQSPKHRREKAYTITQCVLAPGSIIATEDHDLHRARRTVLNPYFSSQNVMRLVPAINDTLLNLLRRMDGWAMEGRPVTLNPAYRAATKDVIQLYCFGEGEKCLDMDDCNAAFFDVIQPHPVMHMGTYAYWLAKLMADLPPSLMLVFVPRIAVFATFIRASWIFFFGLESLSAQIDHLKKADNLQEGKTIFHEILRSDIPNSEKGTKRLTDEAMVLVTAGSETTASTLAAITYHLLADTSLMARLRAELKTVMPEPDQLPDQTKLKNLPFLNALIEEAIRLYPGGSHRQDRLAPDEDIVYEAPDGKTHIIRAGTIVGMAAPLVNRDPHLYPNPRDFRPERYLENPTLASYQFSFSKGARQCIGINLAYQELRILTAGIFRKYDVFDSSEEKQSGPTMELYKTNRDDIDVYADYFTMGQYPGSKGLRVIIRG
ncbi:hypothetical protein NW762_014349 [Fusarium torreyae]|uniref:Trichodiene oxygenase n=1 Tax=Fusarium torreyae TaxID=1237075 RepID=A0A9W8RMZ1_9HYPO|nr:hypothetical protein NW762_014349 [Fusarium torreyae]